MPCIDGEGKPVIKESPYSDEQGLSQRESISLRSMLMVSGLASQRESLYEWMVGKMIFTAKKPFWLSVVRVPLYFWTMRFVTLTA